MTRKSFPLKESLEDPSKCPLCGRPNHCAVAADPNASKCWCETVIFPDELLAKIPEDSVRKTCVCQKCLEEYQESLDSQEQSNHK